MTLLALDGERSLSTTMPQAALLQLEAARPTGLFALVDAARDRAIYPWLKKLPVASCRSLYEMRDDPWLVVAYGPYLVEVSDESLESLCELWGQSSVVFVAARLPFLELRKHFRRFLLVRADGRELHFRFYDPRVLTTFLNNAEPGELATFFGPIETFVVETEDREGGLRFARDSQGRLSRTLIGSPSTSPPQGEP